MIRVVVFDFDGTLVDSNGVKALSLERVVACFERGAEALHAAVAQGGDRYSIFAEVARLLDPDGTPHDVTWHGHVLAGDYTRRCARAIKAARERRGARNALESLKRRGLRVWVASATPERDLIPLLRQRGLTPYLHGALGGPAPKVDNLRRIARAERAAPRQLVLVGDSPDDQSAARELGCWFVAITAEDRLAGPHRFSMRDLTGLPALIARLRARPRSRISA